MRHPAIGREDDGAGDPAGALSPPLAASTLETTGQVRDPVRVT
jgi:hypothetical protein